MNKAIGVASVLIALGLVGCGSSGSSGGASGSSHSSSGGQGGGGGGEGGSKGSSSTASGGGGTGGSAPTVCPAPIALADVSSPTTVVGDGSSGSCTEAALSAAVATGGVITFSCGGAATISITTTLELPKGKDTTIDGGGMVTLDGGGKARILHFDGGDFRKTTTTVTLQRLAFKNAKSTGTMLPAAPAPCSQGYDTDGGGAAVLIRDGVLHVIDSTFDGGRAASPGPDVAGGAIYAIGSLDVTLSGSTFTDNQASNGGAVGSLFSNLTLVNDVFSNNAATGNGENYIDPTCTVNGGESGNGGNGGAVGMDGGESFAVSICGTTFSGNKANALGGAIGRTPDDGVAETHFDKCTLDGNSAKGGGAMYFHHSHLVITDSTISNNTAEGAGGIQADDTQVDMTNVTLAGNSATKGLGGAMSIFGNGGTLTNCTFANNHADAGSGLFGAAIAGGTTFTIDNSVFAGNTSMDCGAPMACQDGSSTGAADVQWPKQHLVCASDDTPCAGANGTTFADPLLGALGDNGGTTKTILPGAGSPAIGIGKACPPTDQRGNPRKQPDGCTAGAVEVE